MTIEEFDNHKFGAKQYCLYQNTPNCKIHSVCFEEKLLGIIIPVGNYYGKDIVWVRCEKVTILPS